MKITGTNQDSKCSICGSTSYGRSCTYGPKKTHVHNDTVDKCIWCGSSAIGTGCPFNPFGKYHQRGAYFNTLAVEAVQNGIIHGIVMKKLAQPITEMTAFKLGIIDANGNQLKSPVTLEERNAYTSSDKYLIKLKKLSEKSIDLINTTLYFESTEGERVEDLKVMYPIELDCRDKITEAINKINSVVGEFTGKGLSSYKIEKIISEAILNSDDNIEHNG
jgi:hypothetical protein